MLPIILKNVRVHNLKGVSLMLPTRRLIVFTGVSGSGKSSLAFDTIFVEGQRRYIESLSTYARRQMGDFQKPDADHIEGISPTIAIEQKTTGNNPRSTVGTLTGIYDFLRVIYAKIGTPHCPISGDPVAPQSAEHILKRLMEMDEGAKCIILAPYVRKKKGAFKDTFAELIRRGYTRIRLDGKVVELQEDLSLDQALAHDIDLVIDRLVINKENKDRLTESVTQALDAGDGVMSVYEPDTDRETLFSRAAFSQASGLSYPPLEPQDFSFNHPLGMCPDCQGLGLIEEFDLNIIIDPELSISEDCCKVASSYETIRFKNIYDNLARLYNFKVTTPWKKLSEKARKAFLYGTDDKWTRMQFVHPEKGTRWLEYVAWRGVLHEARMRYREATSTIYRQKMQAMMKETICPSCKGEKIKPYPAATLLGGKRIAQITAMPIEEGLDFFKSLKLGKDQKLIADELVKEIRERLGFLINVGLHYLNLDRSSPTLSGGEAQRVRLAAQIGSGLVGATYVLDEPSIGLHPRDNRRLIETLKALRDRGNTVLVVEHDEETIAEADYVVDVGPLAGQKGGEIVAHGSLADILSSPHSITGAFLSGREKIAIPKKRRKLAKEHLTVVNPTHHNLKGGKIEIPLQGLIAVTGVSGSGKSSLITDILYPSLSNTLQGSSLAIGAHDKVTGVEALDKVIAIDQTPIGRTPRSNPATYIKLFDEIRDLFTQLPDSKAQGFQAGRFSFNVKEGSCPYCGGMGLIKIDMDFLEDEWVQCSHCKGKRFDETTLSVAYKGKNIHDILEMTVAEALPFFSAIPKIAAKLSLLNSVGLDYIRIGQPSPSLSGGEAQRIKLAKELSRPDTGKTLYILDEPTTGLHFYDVKKLIAVLQSLVDKGNTVLVIEHNMDLVKCADWVIDLGPEGGKAGGKIIGTGTPEQIAKKDTPTGTAISSVLHPHPLVAKERESPPILSTQHAIQVKGASQNNLKGIDVDIPRGKITLCTGPSGSGKSSFAFETLYAEGQRRYAEAMSPYARQFIKQMPKPKVDSIEGLSAAIAIEQKASAGNIRSTVGTMTECYDYLRLLFANLGTPYCPETGEKIQAISKEYVVDRLLELPQKTKLHLLAPITLKRQENFSSWCDRMMKQGFLRARLNGDYFELESPPEFDTRRKNALYLVIDRLMVHPDQRQRLLEGIEKTAEIGEQSLIADIDGKDLFFNLAFAVESTGKSYPPITPHTFSFNTAQGMCLACEGVGVQYGADLRRFPKLLKMSSEELITSLWQGNVSKESLKLFLQLLKDWKIDSDAPLNTLSEEQLKLILEGSDREVAFGKTASLRWIGIHPLLSKLMKSNRATVRESYRFLTEESVCSACGGSRLNPLARNVRIGPLSIVDICRLPSGKALQFVDDLHLQHKTHKLLSEVLEHLHNKLHFLCALGLEYLALDRNAPSLSGGETQRVRLSRQLGSGLTGCLYVLDEPTIGLHPHDNELLNVALKKLCSLDNTLVLVEHDPLTIAIADYILDFGPHAGKRGGKIMAEGTLEEIYNNPQSLTGAYLNGSKTIPRPEKRRKGKGTLSLRKASLHNLKEVNVDFPITTFTCITGVSGSGKSTLINQILRPAMEKAVSSYPIPESIEYLGTELKGSNHFDKVVVLDQSPIGHTVRADVSTYVDLLTPLRQFFAALPEAAIRGLQPKNFSFNHPKGMCTTCWGLGWRTVTLQFLPSVRVACEACHGHRFNPLSLQVFYKGKHMGHILHMTVDEAKDFLPPIPKVKRIIETLISVGLGYLTLGQEIASLSGGEAQRLRLSRELAKRSSGKTLYLLDEPTIGLHDDDIAKLMPIFQSLVDKGNTLCMIEHNLDVIACADYVIDLGPKAGENGGKIIATGTPEDVMNNSKSITGKYIKLGHKL